MKKRKRTRRAVAYVAAFTTASALFMIVARAALPPKTSEQLRREAHFVAQVKIEKITSRKVSASPVPGTNTQFTAQVMVEKIIKSEEKRSRRIQVRYWIPATRPRGWVGPSGQNVLPRIGERGTIYARKSDKALELVQPNGWQRASTRSNN